MSNYKYTKHNGVNYGFVYVRDLIQVMDVVSVGIDIKCCGFAATFVYIVVLIDHVISKCTEWARKRASE